MGTQGHNTDALLQLLGDMWLHARSEWKIPLIRWSFPPWPMTPGETDKSLPFTTETLLVLTYCFTTLRRSRFRVPFPIKTHSLIIQGSRWNHPHEQGIGESREEVAAISDRQLLCLASLSQHHDLTACGTPAHKTVRHEHMGAGTGIVWDVKSGRFSLSSLNLYSQAQGVLTQEWWLLALCCRG
jgi:hypothetical protein